MGALLYFRKVHSPHPLRSQADKKEKYAHEETEITHPVDNEGLFPGSGSRILFIPEPDQKIGAESHAFPSHEHQEDVVPRNQKEHHEDEEVEVNEKSLKARIVLHVTDRV